MTVFLAINIQQHIVNSYVNFQIQFQVNVGCVPKKVMFNAAVHAEYIKDHKDYGFIVEKKEFNFR